jgi:tetratricopeptide (TPR) repeat protein
MIMRFFSCLVVIISFFAVYSGYSQAPDTSRSNLSQNNALQNYRAGRDLEARNRMNEALIYYNEAVRICNAELIGNPSNMDSYVVLTWTLQRQGKYNDVISWGERGLRINANDYRIIETMGEAYFYLNNFVESLRFMQRYVDSMPQGERASVAYFFIGEIFRLQRKFRHADIAYTTALRLDSGLALWWYRLGSVRESAGDAVPAVEAYERALRINPNYPEAREGLARVRNSSG